MLGGTFTDLVYLDLESGALGSVKVPSTPPTFVDGVLEALARSGMAPGEVALLKHGSTIATNSIIERRGAKTGLITTKGFRDVLLAARANRAVSFDPTWDPSPALIQRRHILGVAERVDYEGNELTPLSEAEVREAADTFRARGMEAAAVVYLNSFTNPAHELRTKEILQEELPGVYVCTSYEILPELREFERSSTTVANAYLGPVVSRYLAALGEQLRVWGYRGDVLLTHSGGGVMSLDEAQRVPVRICQSGPAAGVMGGAYIGGLAGYDNVITLDMGGTSCDLALVHRGQPRIASEWRVEFNIPINLPAVDVVTIGAGGGSIAWIDEGGSLRNGPRSAGASPGPVCYGRGGRDPTNTDANLVLGRLAAAFLGGDMAIYPELAQGAVKEVVADRLGYTAAAAADGILRVANANMTNALRYVSVQRGYDPRDFALVAFGGAGPLHAAELARELEIPVVVVPPLPGLTSALGALRVDLRYDHLRPILQLHRELDLERLNNAFLEMEPQAVAILRREGVAEADIRLQRLADVRYYGKISYLTVPLSDGVIDGAAAAELGRRFNEKHLQEFGYTVPPEAGELEVVNVRLVASGPLLELPQQSQTRSGTADGALKGQREVYFREAGGFVATTIYDRGRLAAGATISGPAIVEQADSTTVVPPGLRAEVDDYLNLIIHMR
ncbi:MAG: hydantoinase/oxoprolinase family protein [Dehalococcoidia bacterium]